LDVYLVDPTCGALIIHRPGAIYPRPPWIALCAFNRMPVKFTLRWRITTTTVFVITDGPAASSPLPNAHFLTMSTFSYIQGSSIDAKAVGKKQHATWSAHLSWTRATSSFSSNSLWLTCGSIATPTQHESTIEH